MLLEGYVWARDVVVIFYQTAEVGPGVGGGDSLLFMLVW